MDKFVIRTSKVPKPEQPSTSRSSQVTTSQQTPSANEIPASLVATAEKKGRSFQSKWQITFPWLLYDGDIDKVFCKICKETMSSGVSAPKKKRQNRKSLLRHLLKVDFHHGIRL